jgi:predicted mannosyl-3-phosphoglycerate phosphatase (HAD superfamily)
MKKEFPEPALRKSNSVVFLAVDPFLSARGKPLFEIEGFLAELVEREIPCVWLSERSRSQLDEPWRRLGQNGPFIAESGCAVYLPEGYFHVKPEKTVRLGRFTCIPVATEQPAAREALEAAAEAAGVAVVPLKTLSPRELSQNLGLPQRQAELSRMRDFSELFFFAGAGDEEVARFVAEAGRQKLVLRQHGAFWSVSLGASESWAIQEVSKLFDRALHGRATRIGVAASPEAERIASACDRVLHLVSDSSRGQSEERQFSLGTPGLWEEVLAAILARR